MILSIGEILVDIFKEEDSKAVFPGGAPFNLACNIATFKGDVSFLGAVGKDEYGDFLTNYAKTKLDNLYIKIISQKSTSEAIVTLKDGERSFRFNRDSGADYLLDIKDLTNIDLTKVNIIHIGSLMLSYQEGRNFFYEAVKYIKRYTSIKISFDINYRDDIFSSEAEAKEIFKSALKVADIIKFTEDELELLSGKKDILEGLKTLLNENQIAVVTLGKDGSIFYSKDLFLKVDTKPLKPIDTTGAGDAFYSYFLYSLDQNTNIDNEEDVKLALYKANIVGGLATQKKGAIGVVPTIEELEKYL